MADNFSTLGVGRSDPGEKTADITPHATNAIADIPRAVYVGTGGNITGRCVGDSADRVWKNVPSGSVLPFRFQYIRATGTTAADMIAIY